MTQKFIDRDGLKVLWNQVNLKDYPNNETLMAVIDAIDETKADKDELFSKSWNDLTDRPFYANDSTFDANINPLNNYEKVKGDLYRNISSNSVIKYIKDCTGIDINVPTNGYIAGKNLKVTITNESGEEKVVSIDNPYYIVGVTDNGYPYIKFCSGSGHMPVHEYRIEENDLVYHYVYTHFAVGAWYDYGINPNEWGYNPGTEVWLGTNYSFHFTVENVVKLDEKYIPETISRVGHTHSFDSLEDKPFDKHSFDKLDCVYDPNNANNIVNTNGEKIWYLGDPTDGNESIRYITDSNGRIYKVPFNKTSSYCYKATFNLTGGNEITIYNLLLKSGGIIDGITFPAGGTYATAPLFDDGLFIAKIEYAIYDTLHENYIPDSIARTADIDEKFGGTVEITSGDPEKENTVLIVNPETKEEIDIYSVEEINEKLNQLKNAGLSEELKTVLVTYFTNMQTLLSQLVYISEENIGNTLTNNLTNLIIALGGKICTGISVSYIGGDVPVGTSLSSLSGITVTAYYSDDSTSDISDYVLSGAIAEGENTIIVSYGIHNTSFTVIGKNILTYEPAISTFTAELTSNEDNTYNMNFTASENKYYAALLKYNGEYINELTISHSDLVSSAGNDDGSGDELDLIIIGYNENADYPYYAIFLGATEISGWRFYWNSNAEFIADDQGDLNPAPFSSTDLERVKLIVTTSDDDMVVTVINANTNETIATKTILGLAADGYIPAIGIGGQSVPNTYSNIL